MLGKAELLLVTVLVFCINGTSAADDAAGGDGVDGPSDSLGSQSNSNPVGDTNSQVGPDSGNSAPIDPNSNLGGNNAVGNEGTQSNTGGGPDAETGGGGTATNTGGGLDAETGGGNVATTTSTTTITTAAPTTTETVQTVTAPATTEPATTTKPTDTTAAVIGTTTMPPAVVAQVVEVVASEMTTLTSNDMPLQSAVPKISFEEITSTCPGAVPPTIRAPQTFNGNPVDVLLGFRVERFIELNDVSEYVAVAGTLTIRWVALCIGNTALDSAERISIETLDTVWHPSLLFQSSYDDIGMVNSYYYNDVEVIAKQGANSIFSMSFYWTKVGIFKSSCRLNLHKFPFDTQNCEFKFAIKQNCNLVVFSDQSTITGPEMTLNDEWTLISRNVSVNTVNGTSMLAFSLVIKRKPDFLIANLMWPCIVLVLLELTAFVLDPALPDRPAYFCLIFLALMVSQTGILKVIPRTAQRVLMSDYNLLLTFISGLSTIYTLVACFIANGNPEKVRKTVSCGKKLQLSTIRVVDICLFTAFLVSLIGLNVMTCLRVMA